MALSISILKNILNFKCMHVNNCELIEIKVRAHEEIKVQKIIKVDARPYNVVVKQNCNTVSKNQAYLYDHLLTKGARPLVKE